MRVVIVNTITIVASTLLFNKIPVQQPRGTVIALIFLMSLILTLVLIGIFFKNYLIVFVNKSIPNKKATGIKLYLLSFYAVSVLASTVVSVNHFDGYETNLVEVKSIYDIGTPSKDKVYKIENIEVNRKEVFSNIITYINYPGLSEIELPSSYSTKFEHYYPLVDTVNYKYNLDNQKYWLKGDFYGRKHYRLTKEDYTKSLLIAKNKFIQRAFKEYTTTTSHDFDSLNQNKYKKYSLFQLDNVKLKLFKYSYNDGAKLENMLKNIYIIKGIEGNYGNFVTSSRSTVATHLFFTLIMSWILSFVAYPFFDRPKEVLNLKVLKEAFIKYVNE